MGTPSLKSVHLRTLLIMKTPKKTFDAVKLMRELREKVNEEIANMTPEQVVEYFRIHSAKFESEMSDPKQKASVIMLP